MYTLYKLILNNVDTGESKFYFGISENVERVIRDHKYRLKNNRHNNQKMTDWYLTLPEHEDAITYLNVDKSKDKRHIEKLKEQLITLNVNNSTCLNIGIGYKPSKEGIKRISTKLKHKWEDNAYRKNQSERMVNNWKDPKERSKMEASQRGKPKKKSDYPRVRHNAIKITINNVEYASLSQAANTLQLSVSNLSRAVKENRKVIFSKNRRYYLKVNKQP